MRHSSLTSTTRPARTVGGVLLAAAAVATLAGCSGGPAATPTATTTRTVTASPAPSTPAAAPAATSSATPSCGPSDGATAAARAIAELPLPAGLESARWDPATADTAQYDGCAALSAVTVTVADATGSSPVAILLFHDGTYLGTATKLQYPFEPTVTRTSDAALRVEYRYAGPQDSNADPTGRATATYTWDDAAGRVRMTGEVPPAP
ncbi:LppP/LprE family lipoprotein [Curtobacterium sp. MCBA15_012]|uniref:LppP/LprE family lipoprotein n=1 Tax=Curtobacterium sp. MCBA15_012 TaxID=1898738 RepID=UPI0008DD634B|nr:LppP/LprE family lipoprotein [Curtobacterium sp. MCBA15_012]WIA99529.1 LppP/LprE family lipoprotein [Curtobacterium sp. MCBA15_012]